MMRTAAAEEPSDERIILQTSEVKDTFTAEHPSDDEIEQNARNGKERIASLPPERPRMASASLIFSRKDRKILTPPKVVALCRENSDLILLMDVVDFT
jgi:hypothetical protein